ncbi:hypothetical protein V2G26_017862 [Clonostachys chloroleuca]
MKLLHLYLTVVCHLSHPALSQPQQVVTVTVAAPIPPNEPEWRDSDRFTSAVLNSTNTYRSQHGAADVVWNDTLSDFADDYLDGGDCVFEHSGVPTARIWPRGFDKETGHFTQLVWRNTTDVGCARRLCGSDGWFLACEYWPQGNVEGQYEAAVGSYPDIVTEQYTVNCFVLDVGVFKLHNASEEMGAANLEKSLEME